MFEVDALTTESMLDALSVTANPHNIPVSLNSPDKVEVFPNNLLNNSEERASATFGGKRKRRRPKSVGSSKIVVLGPQGVISGAARRTENSGALNGSAYLRDLDKFDLNSVQHDLSDEEEVMLAERIRRSWGSHQLRKLSIAKSRDELKALRLRLAADFYSYKTHLVRVGRGGGWASFLRERDIPLSTADRYVKHHEISLAPSEGKLLTEEIKDPTKEEIANLVKKLEPKLRSVLTTPESVTQFMAELAVALNRSESAE
jgi:hypothetical protein